MISEDKEINRRRHMKTRKITAFLECGCDILGGCCGSNENCIKLIREAL